MRSKIKAINNSTDTQDSVSEASRKDNRKTPGTRAGTIRDWREGSGKNSQHSGKRRNALRDGR